MVATLRYHRVSELDDATVSIGLVIAFSFPFRTAPFPLLVCFASV